MSEGNHIPKKKTNVKGVICVICLLAGVAIAAVFARMGLDYIEKKSGRPEINPTVESSESDTLNQNGFSIVSADWSNGNWFRGEGYENVKSVVFTTEYPSNKNIKEEWDFDEIHVVHVDGKAAMESNPLKEILGTVKKEHGIEDEDADIVYIILNAKTVIDGRFNAVFQGMRSLESVSGLELLETSKVTSLRRMFADTAIQSIDLSVIETRNVVDMSKMFQNCESLTEIDLSKNDLFNVKDMSYCFNNCKDLKFVDFGVGIKPKNISHIFDGALGNGVDSVDIRGQFNTSSVTDMSFAFSMSVVEKEFIQDLDVGNVENLDGALRSYGHADGLNLSKWDTHNLKTADSFFANNEFCQSVNLDGWSVPMLQSCDEMFYYCYNLESLNMDWKDVNNSVSFSGIFSGCDKLSKSKIASVKEMLG